VSLEPDVAAELESAARELKDGNVSGAVARLERLRERFPDHPRVGALLARAYLRQGQPEAARMIAEEVVRQAPRSASALVALGLARKACRDLAGALEAFARAQQEEPSPFVAAHLARLHLQRGEAAQSLAETRTALRRYGPSAPLLELEGDALMRLGRNDEALASYQAAMAQAPNDAALAQRVLRARLAACPPEEALSEIERLLTIPSYAGEAWLHAEHGRLLYEAGRYKEAQEALTRALDRAPELTGSRRLLGFAAWKAGDTERAIMALRPLFLADPTDRYVRSTLLAAYLRTDRPSEAESLLEEALKMHPEAKMLHGALAKLRRNQGESPQASQTSASSSRRRRKARQLELGSFLPSARNKG